MQKSAEAYEKVKLMEIAAERKQREDAKAQYLKNIEDRKKHNQDLLLDDEARELDELNRNYQNQLDALKEAYNLKLITVKEYNERLKQVNDAYNKE